MEPAAGRPIDVMPLRDPSARFDIAIIGGGSAAEALVRAVADRCDDSPALRPSMAVFEPLRVGGECPFVACMPSKTMIHDARGDVSWAHAVDRRRSIVSHLDDRQHARGLLDHGVALYRSAARLVGEHLIEADGQLIRAEHIVVATGATPLVPDIEGIDRVADRAWTSADALTADERPDRIVVVGAGVIGIECAFLFNGFGTHVDLVNDADRLCPDDPPRVGDILEERMRRLGIGLHHGVEAESVDRAADGVVVGLTDGSTLTAERMLVAVGRRPRTEGLGLERLGLDPAEPLPISPAGRIDTGGSVWAMGDVAGVGEYTHLANHHAEVVADHLVGAAQRRYDDVVVPRCTFSQPPIFEVGPDYAAVANDPDIVEASAELDDFPRAATDDLDDGYLWVAARRSTHTVVAAAGIGPCFDELVHGLVIAIDGEVPVQTLARSMQPFPTVGEILGPVFDDLARQLATEN